MHKHMHCAHTTCTHMTHTRVQTKTHACTHTHISYLCPLDVTVHLVVELVHLQLQQRESGDMSFRNKACSEATGGRLIDVDWISQNTPC